MTGTVCGYFLNVTSDTPVLMSGYRVDANSNNSSSARGETLLMRTLPLVTNPARKALYDGSINFKNVHYPIINALIVSAADGSADSVYRQEPPIAHECMLSWCVKSLRSEYAWGSYREEEITTLLNETKTAFPWNATHFPELDMTDTSFAGNISIFPKTTKPDPVEYGVSNETFVDMVTILDEIFPSLLTVANASAPPFLKIRTSFMHKVVFRAVRFNPFLAPNNVTHHLERMAKAMTDAVRSDTSSNEHVVGSAYAPETYVSVQWAWLTFPLTMLVLSTMFLVTTIFKTSQGTDEGMTTWKTSAMPTLVYSLPKDAQAEFFSHGTSVSDPYRRKRKIKVRLHTRGGWRVSSQACTARRRSAMDQNNAQSERV